ncbi:MAG: leucine-rich repeat domain-containing protein [Catonella sp.]|uniref:leucine-rich repeat domain-containing protein n=1 Tax=Catonella sp. TaxID=2382125 RepID=UPI003F9F4171
MILTKYTGTAHNVADLKEAVYDGDGELTKIAAYAFKEHRELTEVNLPENVEEVGNNAFYNCRNLLKFTFFDKTESFGDGAFRNCTKLDYIGLNSSGGSLRGLKEIIFAMSKGVTVSVYGNELFFPHFQPEFQDNVGAKIVAEIMHGAGMNYRECVDREGIDYMKYDTQFTIQKYSMELDEAVAVCKARLIYPIELRNEKREEYLEFLTNNKKALFDEAAVYKDSNKVLAYIHTGIFATKEDVDEAMDFFCEKDFAEGVNILIDYRNKTFKKTSIMDMEI